MRLFLLKIILIPVFSCLMFQTVAAQSYSIQWNGVQEVEVLPGKQVRIPTSLHVDYNSKGKPIYTNKSVFVGQIISGVRVLKSTLLTDKTGFDPKQFSTNFEVQSAVGIQNTKPFVMTEMCPVRLTPSGHFELLESFEWVYSNYNLPVQQNSSAPNRTSKNTSINAKIAAAGTSILSNGDWYKIKITSDGIYKLDYDFFKSINVNPDNIDPQTIRICGFGGGMLSQANTDSRYSDLPENSIFVSGESDGKFDPQDYVLFVAYGPHSWKYSATDTLYYHTHNIYSDENYYFLNFNTTNGKRITDLVQSSSPGITIRYSDGYAYYEKDNSNLLKSGKKWFGEKFESNQTTQNFSLSNDTYFANSNLVFTVAALARSSTITSLSVKVNSVNAGSISFNGSSLGVYDNYGHYNSKSFSVNQSVIGNGNSNVELTYNKGSNSGAMLYLDYLELNYIRPLRMSGNATFFRAKMSLTQSVSEYEIQNMQNGDRIWNITDIENIRKQEYNLSGSVANFIAGSSTLQEYVIVRGNSFPIPESGGKISNQNLQSIGMSSVPELIIITPQSLSTQANDLADFKRNVMNIPTSVVDVQAIYNEFSSGKQDLTAIRDFIRMVYLRSSGSDSLRYVLLFGDCSYDYKNRVSGNTNLIPVYQSNESIAPLETYCSDDFIGFMDVSEGLWRESPLDPHLLDIGIGRIPARTSDEAAAVVEKIKTYSSSTEALGEWRNKVAFISDDGDGNLHAADANDIAEKVDTLYKFLNVNKLLLDAFEQTTSPNGETSQPMIDRMKQLVDKGLLILNYNGHGGELGWAQEGILSIQSINEWKNTNKYPLCITATCEFGKFDDPGLQSGAEYMGLKPLSGSIANITSSRVVYQFSNRFLNINLYNYTFNPLYNGRIPALGDVIRYTKNASISGVFNRNYVLLGDPSLVLASPKAKVVLTQVNSKSIQSVTTDTIRALQKVTLKGEIRNASDVKLSSYQGKVSIQVYDKKIMSNTLGKSNPIFSYKNRSGFIFSGTASVVNGNWSVEFVVPKDIVYQFGYAKILLYAFQPTSINDAKGFENSVVLGGSNPNAPADNTPPRLQLFMNDESFVNGGITGSDALFIAKLFDENGINTSGIGLGHEMTLIKNNASDPVIVNDFYQANKDDYKNGYVRYNYSDLPLGSHQLRFKAWDTYNNSSESYLDFVVAGDQKMALDHVLNYPNPFSTRTTFHFDHNKPGQILDVKIQIYTVSGKIIKTLQTSISGAEAHFSDLEWDGKDDFGDKIGRGVYIYKVHVKAATDGSTAYQFQKLVILN